ncbi:MAG: HD domain-containing protein, partial [Bacilli bacterium]|nr:HD domain-containing protein [Bacilli bacterium]
EEAIYLFERDEDIRSSFFRDIDRVLYSLAFIRLQDKTQVFSYTEHDHISKRMIHVQFVSKIARTIGRALGLNEDLIEAAALGHDLGHVPFGHVGERILNDISLKNNEGFFNHNIESARVLMNIENYGKGLNVSVQVLDAIICHNGEIAQGIYKPRPKTKEEFLKEYNATYKDKTLLTKLEPMTLEGCVVRVSDLIAYIGRDLDDAIRLKKIKREDIPESITKILGSTTKEIVNVCINDIVMNSYNKNYIKLSDNIYNAIEELKKYNYTNIYNNSESAKTKTELEHKFNILFKTYIKDIENNNENSPIIKSYLNNMCKEYFNNNTKERIVLDYIAGMTDDYFLKEYERINKND